MRTLHVVPVPGGMSPEEAWAEIEVFGHLPEQLTPGRRFVWRLRHGPTRWATIEVDDDTDQLWFVWPS